MTSEHVQSDPAMPKLYSPKDPAATSSYMPISVCEHFANMYKQWLCLKRSTHAPQNFDTQSNTGKSHSLASWYAVATCSSTVVQDDIKESACSKNAAPSLRPFSFLMGAQRSSSNSSGGSVMICMRVSKALCVFKKFANSLYACIVNTATLVCTVCADICWLQGDAQCHSHTAHVSKPLTDTLLALHLPWNIWVDFTCITTMLGMETSVPWHIWVNVN